MKSALIIALTVLKLVVEGVPSVSAETRWEHWLQSRSEVPTPVVTSPQQDDQQASQSLEKPRFQSSLIRAAQPEKNPLSERDRLIQERFLIKLIPAQNQ